MPIIHIKSLPFEAPIDISTVLEHVGKDFAKDTGVDLNHITTTWHYFPADHYAVAGKSVYYQPLNSHPVLVDLITPDVNSDETVEKMLYSVARSISKWTDIPLNNIFISHGHTRSGMVFDSGEIARW